MQLRNLFFLIILSFLSFNCQKEISSETQNGTLPLLTTTVATAVTSISALSGGNITDDGGAPVTARGVCWDTTHNLVVTGNHTIDGTGTGTFISNITGLNPSKTFYVRAYATNTAGTAYGNEISFTTTATGSVVLPTLTTTAVNSITSTAASSGGNIIADGGAPVTARGVCWSTLANPVATGNHTTDGTGTGIFTSAITGLTPGTPYFVRAYATNSAGTAYGNEVSFVTLPGLVNTVFIGGDDSTLYALNAINGTVKWTFKLPSEIVIAPTVDNNTVYIAGKTFFTPYQLYALDATTGILKWKTNQLQGVSTTGAVSGGLIYLGTGATLTALDTANGATVWQKTMNTLGISVLSAPTVVNNKIFIGHDSSVYAINPANGNTIWKTTTHADIYYSGVAATNGNVYVGNGVWGTGNTENKLYSINASTGSVNWSVPGSLQMVSSPTNANGIIYIGNMDHKLYAIDDLTHTIKWTFLTGDFVLSSPIVSNNKVYVGSNDHYLYCIDASVGSQIWKTDINDAIIASPVVANGMVYVACQNSQILYALNANTGTVIWTKFIGVAASSGGYKSSPCVVDQNGVIFNSGISGQQN